MERLEAVKRRLKEGRSPDGRTRRARIPAPGYFAANWLFRKPMMAVRIAPPMPPPSDFAATMPHIVPHEIREMLEVHPCRSRRHIGAATRHQHVENLTEDTAADRTRYRVADRAEALILHRRAGNIAADEAGNELYDQWQILFHFLPLAARHPPFPAIRPDIPGGSA